MARPSPAPLTRPLRRLLLPALLSAGLVLPLAPSPAAAQTGLAVPPLTAASLQQRYRAEGSQARAAAAAEPDGARRDALSVLAGRQLLDLGTSGEGRVVEVFGDLAVAHRVAVLVPGADTRLDRFTWADAAGAALRHQMQAAAPAEPTAVVVWFGYPAPATLSPAVLTTARADQGAVLLSRFVRQLQRAAADRGGSLELTLVCHSYGAVVCGRAAAAVRVQDLAVLGAPGLAADDVGQLRTTARVWAGRGAADWVRTVPHVALPLGPAGDLGFGSDPMSDSFGARRFAAGDGGHSDYFRPGGVALRNLARIVLGRDAEVTA